VKHTFTKTELPAYAQSDLVRLSWDATACILEHLGRIGRCLLRQGYGVPGRPLPHC
jgi:hypothetical protein